MTASTVLIPLPGITAPFGKPTFALFVQNSFRYGQRTSAGGSSGEGARLMVYHSFRLLNRAGLPQPQLRYCTLGRHGLGMEVLFSRFTSEQRSSLGSVIAKEHLTSRGKRAAVAPLLKIVDGVSVVYAGMGVFLRQAEDVLGLALTQAALEAMGFTEEVKALKAFNGEAFNFPLPAERVRVRVGAR